MTISDETLMAYADGELDEPERSAVERALRADPALAAAVERHRALRADVHAAFAGVLDEPVPARLRGRGATVTSLDAVRAARAQEAAAAVPDTAPPRQRSSWAAWGGMAASLAVGVLGASLWFMGGGSPTMVAADDGGRLLARGALAQALSTQLAGAGTTPGEVQVGITFAARDGAYCRSFTLATTAGLACLEADGWRIPVLKETAGETTAYRQASSALPGAVLEAIDERIEGEALDAAAERAARERGWRRP